MYSRDVLFLCSLECYFGVCFPPCFATREINTKITLSWALKQLSHEYIHYSLFPSILRTYTPIDESHWYYCWIFGAMRIYQIPNTEHAMIFSHQDHNLLKKRSTQICYIWVLNGKFFTCTFTLNIITLLQASKLHVQHSIKWQGSHRCRSIKKIW